MNAATTNPGFAVRRRNTFLIAKSLSSSKFRGFVASDAPHAPSDNEFSGNAQGPEVSLSYWITHPAIGGRCDGCRESAMPGLSGAGGGAGEGAGQAALPEVRRPLHAV